jgi:hypothetical protein
VIISKAAFEALELNVAQSSEDRYPFWPAVAWGRPRVKEPPARSGPPPVKGSEVIMSMAAPEPPPETVEFAQADPFHARTWPGTTPVKVTSAKELSQGFNH